MGYYTNYKLSFKNGDEVVEFFEFPELEKLSFTQLKKSLPNVEEHFIRMERLRERVKEGPVGFIEHYLIPAWKQELNETKWYDHEKNMKDFSKNFPETLFILEGQGEESEDIWKKYFKNGKVQVSKVIMTFEPYDERKLK